MSYAIFGGDDYYPSGGWYDHIATVETLEEAKVGPTDDHLKDHWRNADERLPTNGGLWYSAEDLDWWHAVDLTTGQVVAETT